MNQEVIRGMSGNLGFRVDVASSGQDAIDAALHISYGLIFIDCHAPGVDGDDRPHQCGKKCSRTVGKDPERI